MKTAQLKYCAILALGLLTNCQKVNTNASDLIIGKWNWVKTITPYFGQKTDPLTEGYSLYLEFTANHILNEYRNDSLIISSAYTIKNDQGSSNSGILTSNSIINSKFYIINDSLIFNEEEVDGPVSSFVWRH